MSNVSTYSMYDARRPHLHVGSQVGLGRRLASTVIVRVDPREEIRTSASPRKSKETVRGIDFDEAASEAAKKNKTPKPALTDEQLKRFAFKQKKTPAEIAQNAMEQFLQRKPTSLVSESTAAPIPVAPKVTFKPNVRSVVNQLGLSPRLPPVAKKASTSPQRKEGKRKTKRLTSFEVDSVQSKDSKPNRVPSASQNRPSSRARPSSSRQGFLRMTPLLPSLPSSSAGSGGHGASTSRTRAVTDGWDFSSSSSDDGMEDAIRFEYDVQMDSWRKVRVRIEMEETPCNCGSRFRVFRIASHSNWPGLHADAKFVAKRLTKCAEEERERYFDVVKTQSVGRFWGQQFEEQQRAVGLPDHSICRMQFLESWVMECSDRPGKPLFVVEPMISGIRRQSLPRKEGVAQVDREQHRTVNVFAHFTWHQSAETLVIRGMEVLVAEKCLFRDPVIHSSTGYGFGTTNHGSRGVMEFLHSHTCDEACRQLQLPPMLHEIEAEQKKKRIPSAGAVKRAAEVKEFESMRSDERQESSYRLRMLTRMLEELSPQRAHPSAEFSAATPRPSFLENSSHRAHHSPVAGRADSSASTQGGPNSESFSSRSPSNGPKPVYSHTMAYIELRRQRDLAANPDSLGHADSVKSNADRAMSDFHHTNEALGSKLTVLDRSIEALKSRLGSSPAVVSEAMPESAEP